MAEIALVKRVKYVGDVYKRLLEGGFDIDNAVLFLEGIPDADVTPVVHGRWEEYLIPNILCCSNCDWGIDPLCKSPYCPNCGAKMDIEDGGDNDVVD